MSCARNTPSDNWVIALKTSKIGERLEGSKAKLIQAIRNGNDIKIGWGSKGKSHTIEHLSEPIWLAILDEKEVLAKLHPQSLPTIDWDSLNANYSNTEILNQEWRVVITTKGTFDAIWYDRKLDTLIKRVPQQHSMTWFVSSNSSINNNNFFE